MSVLFTAALFSMSVQTNPVTVEQQYQYSNQEYCALVRQDASKQMLSAYADKLGFVPAKAECKALLSAARSQITETSAERQIREFSRGSIRKLTPSVIQQLKAMSEQERLAELQRIFG
ncbi:MULTISPECIES: hypothetical protein [Rheinheimera]|uniref:DUF2059 domain-containing protein n=1 Tax=Rheinheimera marina TaxID=1774958 RepID=A0ABV9JGH0_9GAMM